jgi:signal transduction histidine kinase
VQEELLRQERLATLGKLAGGLAHQIRNPLSVITNATNILRRAVGHDDASDAMTALAIIREEVWRANRIITDLLDYARVRQAVRVPNHVSELVDQVLTSREIPARIRIVRELPDLPAVVVDAAQVHGALDNLVDNAFDAMPRGGTLTLRAFVEGDSIILAVEDSGEGIPREIRDRIFEPLLTTKPEGLGLGLTTARALVENQGGTIRFHTSPSGTRFELVLPTSAGGA